LEWLPGPVQDGHRRGHDQNSTRGSRLSYPASNVGVVDLVYNPRKFAELILLVAERLQHDRAGGTTKLNNALFFIEFTHLRRHQSVVSGCEFQKLPQGPAPRQSLPVRTELIRSGEAELVDEGFWGKAQQQLIPLRPANLEVFTSEELETIEDVLGDIAGMSGAQISELSHQEPGWRLTEVGETIPLSTAFLGCQQVSTPTAESLVESVEQRYGFAASR